MREIVGLICGSIIFGGVALAIIWAHVWAYWTLYKFHFRKPKNHYLFMEGVYMTVYIDVVLLLMTGLVWGITG